MQFLTPATLAVAAAVTIPPLVALYFLKLKRRTYAISSTLLWRKAIEDLHVNAPFQRLRSSLLLFLQLLVLILGAVALGRPMLARERQHEDTLILMIDQSASMGVVEGDGRTRLDIAKAEAKRVVDAMDKRSRAMVIAFCDRATLVSSFDTDRNALKKRIDTIEQTDSTSTLGEAVTLAEAYSQNLILGGATEGTDVAPESAAPPASVLLFTDGRIADAAELSPQRLDLSRMEVVHVGSRRDNVGIIAMDARRSYETPEVLQVFATVRNYADVAMTFDAALYLNGEHVDVQGVELAPGAAATDEPRDAPAGSTGDAPAEHNGDAETLAPPGSVASIAFDEVEYEDAGIVEVRLSVRDALTADNRAYAVIRPPRRIDALLVTRGNVMLKRAVSAINLRLKTLKPDEYENADADDLMDGNRSRFDLVIFDACSTARLPVGNYMFWGAAPEIEGVEDLGWIEGDIIIDWSDTHPLLRHLNPAAINAYAWKRIKLPNDAVRLIEGQSPGATALAYLTRGGSQFLICAFPLLVTDEESGMPASNTDWFLRADFITFLSDVVQYLASSAHAGGLSSLRPGQPATVTLPARTPTVTVKRPDGLTDTIPTGGGETIHYARTRRVGVYEIQPAAPGENTLAVNLFSADESNVAPRDTVVIGSSPVSATSGANLVNEQLWPALVVALLLILILEWIVYNRRVFV